MASRKRELAQLYRTSEYYERMFRARFIRAMQAYQRSLNDDAIQRAAAAGNKKHLEVLLLSRLDAAMKPLEDIFVTAFMKGGEIGAVHVKEALNG